MRRSLACFGLVVLPLLAGCGSANSPQALEGADPQAVQRDVDHLSVSALQAKAQAYHEAVLARRAEMDRLRAQRADLGPQSPDSAQVQEIENKMKTVADSITRLTLLYGYYVDKLRQLGQDTHKFDL